MLSITPAGRKCKRPKCPRQESNLVFDLRKVACDPAHSKDRNSSLLKKAPSRFELAQHVLQTCPAPRGLVPNRLFGLRRSGRPGTRTLKRYQRQPFSKRCPHPAGCLPFVRVHSHSAPDGIRTRNDLIDNQVPFPEGLKGMQSNNLFATHTSGHHERLLHRYNYESCEGWNRTSISMFKASDPTVRRPRI